MPKYITLVSWTDQGIRDVKDSPKRVEAVRAAGKKYGCTMTDLYLTVGTYDIVTTVDAPDDESAAKFLLAVGSSGNVRTTTLRAFPEEEFRQIVGGL